MSIITGEAVTVNYDVVAFDAQGRARIMVSSEQPLHGAIACCCGFNRHGTSNLVAAPVPAGSVEVQEETEPAQSLPQTLTPQSLTERNFCRSARKETRSRKRLLAWVTHFFNDCDRAYFAVYDCVMEHFMSIGVDMPANGSNDDCLAMLELRLSRSETLSVWQAALSRIAY